ncbi:MAG: leucine-rich repeat domain-containing protein, partial [Alphaproteobacteria bacterium]|nr:leucine-rich repeat domain-containing protein [Alphaproteobacteria bacterium]
MKNKLLGLSLSALMILAGNVSADCDEIGYFDCGTTGDVKWYVSQDQATLTISGTGATGNYVEEKNPNYNGTTSKAYARTTAPWGIYNNTVTTIEVSEGVTDIGKAVFEGFDQVTNVSLPNTLQSIGWDSFNRTSKLNSIEFPSSLTSLGVSAFWGSGLTHVVVPNTITSIDEGVFDRNENLIEVIIPDSVTSIGYVAFAYTRKLKNLILPDSVTEIATDAFKETSAQIYCHKDLDCSGKGTENIVTYDKQGGVYMIGDKYYTSLENMQNDISRASNDTTD